MVGTSTSTYHCEQSLPNQDVCSTYRTCSGRARCGKIDRSIAQPTECFSWRGYSHRGLSKKALDNLLQYDSSPVTPCLPLGQSLGAPRSVPLTYSCRLPVVPILIFTRF